MTPVLVLRGAPAIGQAIGEDPDRIGRLVKSEGLPAYRINGRGPWIVTVRELEDWAVERAKRMRETMQ